MNLWWSVRRPWIVVLAVLVYVGFMLVVKEDVVNVPSITLLGSAGIKLMNFLPLIPCVGVLYCLDRRLRQAEATGVRAVVMADRGLVLATGVVLMGVGYLLSWTYGMGTAPAAGRNALFLLGLALVVRTWSNAAVASSAAAGWLFLTVVAGLKGAEVPYLWAILLEPAHRPHAVAAAAVMLLLGLACMGVTGGLPSRSTLKLGRRG